MRISKSQCALAAVAVAMAVAVALAVVVAVAVVVLPNPNHQGALTAAAGTQIRTNKGRGGVLPHWATGQKPNGRRGRNGSVSHLRLRNSQHPKVNGTSRMATRWVSTRLSPKRIGQEAHATGLQYTRCAVLYRVWDRSPSSSCAHSYRTCLISLLLLRPYTQNVMHLEVQ